MPTCFTRRETPFRKLPGVKMKNENLIAHGASRPFLTTQELALALAMSAQSIRKRYSQTGSYFGLKPVKLPNRKLRWPADALDQLMGKAA